MARPALERFFGQVRVAPVLTAHPTEVRRKSTLDREREVARLLDERDRQDLTPEELEASDETLRRAVLTLWQTSILRRVKPTVADEVANGLAYYGYTFLSELPRFYATLEDQLAKADPDWAQVSICRPSCAWAAGSVAIATAIPLSPPRC